MLPAVKELSVIARAAGESEASLPGRPESTVLSDEARAFLQRRVASFGLVSAIISGLFLVYRGVASLIEARVYGISGAWVSLPFQAGMVTAFVVQWMSCRGRLRSLRVLRAIEASCLIVGSTAGALMT